MKYAQIKKQVLAAMAAKETKPFLPKVFFVDCGEPEPLTAKPTDLVLRTLPEAGSERKTSCHCGICAEFHFPDFKCKRFNEKKPPWNPGYFCPKYSPLVRCGSCRYWTYKMLGECYSTPTTGCIITQGGVCGKGVGYGGMVSFQFRCDDWEGEG